MASDIRRRLGFAAAVAIAVAACSGSAAHLPRLRRAARAAAATPAAATPAAASSGPAAPAPRVHAARTRDDQHRHRGPVHRPQRPDRQEMKNASSMAFDAINWTDRPVQDQACLHRRPVRPGQGRRGLRAGRRQPEDHRGHPRLAQLRRRRPDGSHGQVQDPALLRDGRHRRRQPEVQAATRRSTATGPPRAGRIRPSSPSATSRPSRTRSRPAPTSPPRRRSRSTARTPTGAARSARASRTS